MVHAELVQNGQPRTHGERLMFQRCLTASICRYSRPAKYEAKEKLASMPGALRLRRNPAIRIRTTLRDPAKSQLGEIVQILRRTLAAIETAY
jgi:hypothetical protein